MTSHFNKIYRANPDYYGTSVSQEFCDFLTGISSYSLNCLDLGAGQGRYSLHLARSGFQVQAIDNSAVAMAQLANSAKLENLAITTKVADLCNYNLPTNEYNLIIGTTVFDHLNAHCIKKIATAVINALRPGGLIYCEVFTTADPGYGQQSDQACSETAGPVQHYFETGELRELFPQLTPLTYSEGVKRDRAHGLPHWHGLALLIGVKP